MKTRVKLLTSMVIDYSVWFAGSVVEVDAVSAGKMLEQGLAEAVGDDVPLFGADAPAPAPAPTQPEAADE